MVNHGTSSSSFYQITFAAVLFSHSFSFSDDNRRLSFLAHHFRIVFLKSFGSLLIIRCLFRIQAGNEGHTSRKWCKKRGLEEQRFYEMTKLRQQFRHILRDAGLLPGESAQETSSSQRSIRHGEVQHLRSLKRDYIQSGQKKRKVLKLADNIQVNPSNNCLNQYFIKQIFFFQ